MKKYISKRIVIEAIQYDGKNFEEILLWIKGREAEVDFLSSDLVIHTLEGDMKANPTDWVIKGTEGEFYPCKDVVFKRKYEESEKLSK